LPNVRLVQLPAGKLSVHEEFPDVVAGAVGTFLAAVEHAAVGVVEGITCYWRASARVGVIGGRMCQGATRQ
jgi:hypothetical protein